MLRAMELLEIARSSPLHGGFDLHDDAVAPWALEGGVSRALERLRDSDVRKSIREEIGSEQENWDNMLPSTGWESVYVSSLSKGRDPDPEGKNLAQIGEDRGEDPSECMMDLLLEQGVQAEVPLPQDGRMAGLLLERYT